MERSGSIYVRYYTSDAEGKPVRRVEFLCQKDEKHHSLTAKPAQQLLNLPCDSIADTFVQ